MNKAIISFFVLGLSFGSGPCLASCGPIILSYIVGTKKNILKGFLVYALFSLSRILVYLILGILFFIVGKFFLEGLIEKFSRYLSIIGGAFIVLLGALTLIGRRIGVPVCGFLQKNLLEHDKKSVILLGLIFGLLPCAPLLAVYSYIGLMQKSLITSQLYILSFGLGSFFSPLILIVLFAGFIPQFLIAKKEAYSRYFSVICGIIIIWLGVDLILKAF